MLHIHEKSHDQTELVVDTNRSNIMIEYHVELNDFNDTLGQVLYSF